MFSERVAGALIHSLGKGYFFVAFVLLGVVPLVMLAITIGHEKRYGARFGLLMGLTASAWASLCWIVIPYCGGYPNLPGATIGAVLFNVGTWGQEISIYVTNLILWPFLGWLTLRSGDQSKSVRSPRRPGGGRDAFSDRADTKPCD